MVIRSQYNRLKVRQSYMDSILSSRDLSDLALSGAAEARRVILPSELTT